MLRRPAVLVCACAALLLVLGTARAFPELPGVVVAEAEEHLDPRIGRVVDRDRFDRSHSVIVGPLAAGGNLWPRSISRCGASGRPVGGRARR